MLADIPQKISTNLLKKCSYRCLFVSWLIFIIVLCIIEQRCFSGSVKYHAESFYLYQKCQSILYYALNHNNCNEVALVYSKNSHEEGNMIKGSQTNTDLESDTKTYELLNRNDNKVCVLVHNHPTDSAFSIEDYSEFLLYGKLKIMVVVTNSGEQYHMTKTEYFDRNAAVKKLIEITKMCDHNNDGKLNRSESVQAAKEFERVAYVFGIRIEEGGCEYDETYIFDFG